MSISRTLFEQLTAAEFVLAGLTLVALFFVSAPYGRHSRGGWGPSVSARVGWWIMEWPAVVWVAWLYAQGPRALEPVPLALLGLWMVHYVYRTLIYPLRTPSKRSMPLAIAGMGMSFQLLNGTINALWLSHFSDYDSAWLHEPRFVVGVVLFAGGYAVNHWADGALRRLRQRTPPGEYAIPHGGLYDYVSCPNYLGEILEWTGFALACWSLPGLAFAAYTIANLAPRALAHHRWYGRTFSDYPAQRKALLPGIL